MFKENELVLHLVTSQEAGSFTAMQDLGADVLDSESCKKQTTCYD